MKTLPILALVSALAAVPAAAQEDIPRVLTTDEQLAQAPVPPGCGKFEEGVAELGAKYHETVVATMLADSGAMVTILASADGATFTILVVQPNGIACFLSSGTTFEYKAPATPKLGRES